MDQVLTAEESIGQVALNAAGVFANTLLSTLFNRIYSGLFEAEPANIDPFNIESVGSSGVTEAQDRFASIVASNPIATTEYSALSEFLVCPPSGTISRGTNNCVMDTNFAAAINRSQGSGSALTVQDAIDEGLLRGNLLLFLIKICAQSGFELLYTRVLRQPCEVAQSADHSVARLRQV